MRKLWNITAGLIATVVILLAVIVGIFRLVVDHAPEYKQQIETWASQAIGMQVTLESIDARMRFLGPELFFTGAQIRQDDNELPLLQAQQGWISMDLIESVRSRTLAPGRVILSGAQVELVRDADGKFTLAGFTPDQATESEQKQTFDTGDLPDGAFELRNSTLIIDDSASGGERWSVTSLRVALERRGDSLEVSGSTDLPDSLGSRMSFEIDMQGSFDDIDKLDARVSADIRDVIFAGWHDAFPGVARLPATGDGYLAFWLFLEQGKLLQANARADLNNVRLSGGETYEYRNLTGRAEWDRTVSGWNARVSDFRIETDGHRWPETQIKIELSQGAADTDVVVYADANFLRLDDLVPLANLLPESQFRKDLDRFAPRGDVTDILLQYSGAANAAASYTVQADIDRFSVNASEHTPGVSNLKGRLRASQSGGQLQTGTGESIVDLPWLFRDPIPLHSIDGTLIWRNNGNAIRIISDRLMVSTIDGDLELNFDLNLPGDGAPANMELQGFATDMQVSGNVAPYLPTKIMPPAVVNWLENAFRGGFIPQAHIELTGPLNHFPFRNDEGLFRIAFEVENSTLNYADNWPLITSLWADVVFENEGLTITGKRAEIVGAQAGSMTASFDDLANGKLRISADAAGPLKDLHSFVLQSPLINTIGDVVPAMILEGDGRVELDMTVPVKDLSQTSVRFALDLVNGSLGLGDLPFRFEDLNGTFNFDNTLMDASGITGTLFGQPVIISMQPHPDTPVPDNDTLVIVHGVAEADSLVEGLDLPLSGRLSGKTDWRADARIVRRREGRSAPFEVLFGSTLQGMEIDLPAPLGKALDEAIDMRALYRLSGDRASVDIDYGHNSSGILYFDRRDVGDQGRWRLYSGTVMLGGMDAIPSNANGLVVAGRMEQLVLEDWLSLIPEERGDFRLQDVLHSVDVDVDEALALGHRFPRMRLKMGQGESAWAIDVNSELIQGNIQFPFDLGANAPLQLDLDRLYLTDPVDDDGGNPDPRVVPHLAISIDDFDLAGRRLGKVSSRVIPDDNGIDITNIVTQSETLSIAGSGRWEVIDSGQRSAFKLECQSTDFGATLVSLSIPDGLTAKTAQASVDVWWPGPPDGHFVERINGTMSFDIDDGNLTEVKPGAGRLFGLLSVSALPRRLALDFSDVFQKGLAFDSLGGDFELFDGDAFTDSLTLDGPAAKVLIVGRTGIAKRDYDQIAVVSTNIGRSLAIPSAFAAGPGVGAAVWLFSEIFKDPLTDISRVSYQITGSWDDPKIERVTEGDQEMAQGAAE